MMQQAASEDDEQGERLQLALDLPMLAAGRMLDADDVAFVLGKKSRKAVYDLVDRGALRAYRISRALRFAPSDVLRLLEAGRDDEWGSR